MLVRIIPQAALTIAFHQLCVHDNGSINDDFLFFSLAFPWKVAHSRWARLVGKSGTHFTTHVQVTKTPGRTFAEKGSLLPCRIPWHIPLIRHFKFIWCFCMFVLLIQLPWNYSPFVLGLHYSSYLPCCFSFLFVHFLWCLALDRNTRQVFIQKYFWVCFMCEADAWWQIMRIKRRIRILSILKELTFRCRR